MDVIVKEILLIVFCVIISFQLRAEDFDNVDLNGKKILCNKDSSYPAFIVFLKNKKVEIRELNSVLFKIEKRIGQYWTDVRSVWIKLKGDDNTIKIDRKTLHLEKKKISEKCEITEVDMKIEFEKKLEKLKKKRREENIL